MLTLAMLFYNLIGAPVQRVGIQTQLFFDVEREKPNIHITAVLYITNNSADTIYYPIRAGQSVQDGIISAGFYKVGTVTQNKYNTIDIACLTHCTIHGLHPIAPSHSAFVVYQNTYESHTRRWQIKLKDQIITNPRIKNELMKEAKPWHDGSWYFKEYLLHYRKNTLQG